MKQLYKIEKIGNFYWLRIKIGKRWYKEVAALNIEDIKVAIERRIPFYVLSGVTFEEQV